MKHLVYEKNVDINLVFSDTYEFALAKYLFVIRFRYLLRQHNKFSIPYLATLSQV